LADTSTVTEKGTSLWRDAWLRLRKNKVAVVSGVFLIVMFLLCFVAAWFTGDPNEQDLANKFAAVGSSSENIQQVRQDDGSSIKETSCTFSAPTRWDGTCSPASSSAVKSPFWLA
jgi:hypothetical protein